MESTIKKIGIISLGWLGESLAKRLSQKGFDVWGTLRSEKKKQRLEAETKIHPLFWSSDGIFSKELKTQLQSTDLLILNLPPSVFTTKTYANGLMDFVLDLNTNAQVIFTSSTGIYPNDVEDAREDYLFSPAQDNALDHTLLSAERLLKSALKKRLTILRLAGLIGEDRNPVHYLAKKASNDNPESPVNLIHRTDILNIVELILEKKEFGEIFNLCHPEHPTRKKYYSFMSNKLGLETLKFSRTALHSKEKVVNCSKLVNKLNYKDFVPLM